MLCYLFLGETETRDLATFLTRFTLYSLAKVLLIIYFFHCFEENLEDKNTFIRWLLVIYLVKSK